jgi:Lipopolysaccharide kinase (Kdo/WaaP) family
MASGSLLSRESTSFWRRWLHGVRRTWQRGDWPTFAGDDWAGTIMQAGVTDDFHAKQGRSTGRLLLEKNGQSLGVYLKRHYRLPWWNGLLASLWPWGNWSPAVQELRNLQWAQTQGLPVPAPVAAAEYVGPWGSLQSILAVEELTGMLALHQAIPLASRQLDPISFRIWKKGLAQEMARLSRELHSRCRFHKDLYLCHFYVAHADTAQSTSGLRLDAARLSDWRGRVSMIDFHRLGRHVLTWPIWLVKDLGQLLYSSHVEGVDDRDRLWFWRCYQGKGMSRSLLARVVRLKTGMYQRHARRKALRARVGISEPPA